MQGTPRYTSQRDAYATTHAAKAKKDDSFVDAITVAFEDEDGDGIYAEFRFSLFAFQPYGRIAVRTEVFGDALEVLGDRRIKKVLKAISEREIRTRSDLLGALEENGIEESKTQAEAVA